MLNATNWEVVEREANIGLKDEYFAAWDRTVERPKTRIDMGREQEGEGGGDMDLSSLSPAELETMLAGYLKLAEPKDDASAIQELAVAGYLTILEP